MGYCKLDCPDGETECCICCDKQDSCQCRCDDMDCGLCLQLGRIMSSGS